MKITTIVPRLPPAIDGLGDYASILAKRILQDYLLNSEFIVGDPSWSGEKLFADFPARKVQKRSPDSLLELLPCLSADKNIVLLHYVGYGYAKRGCPVWLVNGLQKWYRQTPNSHLITIFHEVYAYGPIWNSQFWTSPLQRSLATRLINLSDQYTTSNRIFAQRISKLIGGKDKQISINPVFSNVGEPDHLNELSERKRQLVIFGGVAWRRRAYYQSRSLLEETCIQLEIEEILDIGAPLDLEINSVAGVAINFLGKRSPEEISHFLSDALVGFLCYPNQFLAKSGVFAAYCAHRLLPVCVSERGENEDGLEAGKNYYLLDTAQTTFNISLQQVIADNAHNWYQQHSVKVQAHNLYQKLY